MQHSRAGNLDDHVHLPLCGQPCCPQVCAVNTWCKCHVVCSCSRGATAFDRAPKLMADGSTSGLISGRAIQVCLFPSQDFLLKLCFACSVGVTSVLRCSFFVRHSHRFKAHVLCWRVLQLDSAWQAPLSIDDFALV